LSRSNGETDIITSTSHLYERLFGAQSPPRAAYLRESFLNLPSPYLSLLLGDWGN
jgi:hypothetical protein